VFLDEPTSGLGSDATLALAILIKKLRARYTIVLIEHDMHLVMDISDRVHALNFGSTITERSIPYELDGTAEINYRLEGVEARFCVPARYVEWRARTGEKSASAKRKKDTRLENLPDNVLLVEDSMIIALDAEDCLKELGIETVRIESSVAAALDALAKSRPELAILDYNLGKENSEPVAAKLKELGVPFWLATGYGEMQDRLEELGASGLLTKPYGKDELVEVIGSYDKDS